MPVLGSGIEDVRPGLPLDRRIEVAGLGMGRGEGRQVRGVLPGRELTRRGGRLDGLPAVAKCPVGASGAEPGEAVEGEGLLGVELDGGFEVGDGLGVRPQGLPGEAAPGDSVRAFSGSSRMTRS